MDAVKVIAEPRPEMLHQAGWNRYLDRLAVRAGGGDPGPADTTLM